ncbi:tetratricopeptide repeat protein [Aggregicoccus sp. 17bor-14]|uniref:thioredoxin family protein n=1 Tax=Myxococcaceae TaxID=31 RepID=UPI00129CB125|nr:MULTISPECIES: thioredoxin family protein [Myxococcaceae]MBF5042246.1 thioredoxin family protein [Simulacricoccus sp. 17bor-14]MRI88021.1 tetratricopeptide repeat protein [Aggregicoccus sp. 17bor-14]
MRSALLPLLLLATAPACTAARVQAPEAPVETAAHALPFVVDDAERALAAAKAQGVPLFVDLWAPWCRPCLAMRANVFTDAALARYGRRFVWLELNTELAQNAAFLEEYPFDVLPTLTVLDPRSGKVLVRSPGSATVTQVAALLESGERAYWGPGAGLEAELARADALLGAGHVAEAVDAYARTLQLAPPDWERRGRALESLLSAQGRAGAHEACARTAQSELARLERSPRWAAVAASGLGCALETKDAGLQGALEARVREALAPPLIELVPEDRSALHQSLVRARRTASDAPGVRAAAEAWLGFLEQEAARAPTAEARAALDSHRVSAAVALGAPERAVAALEQSERDLPGDPNTSTRLAGLYHAQGRLADAIAASGRAVTKVQGPRRLRVLRDRATLLEMAGRRAEAIRTLEEALTYAEDLSRVQVPTRTRDALERQLRALRSEPAPEH